MDNMIVSSYCMVGLTSVGGCKCRPLLADLWCRV